MENGDRAIAYRVQSEGWAVERAVAGTVNPKSILDVSMVRDYRLVLTYAKDEEHVIGYVVTDRYPIAAIEKVGVGGLASEIRFVPVVNSESEDVVGVGVIADLLDIVGLNLFLEYEEGVGVGATANMLKVIAIMDLPELHTILPYPKHRQRN